MMARLSTRHDKKKALSRQIVTAHCIILFLRSRSLDEENPSAYFLFANQKPLRGSKKSMQQVFEIPADVNYEPQAVELPDYFLRPAPPPIDENDWPVWRAAQEFLPKPRQIRALRCRRHALHIVKETITGNVESVNPIACGDRAACPRCATAYAHERWWDHWSKLGVVALSQHVRLHILEFRCAIPEWNAAVKVAGCELSETIGRLCAATTTCG